MCLFVIVCDFVIVCQKVIQALATNKFTQAEGLCAELVAAHRAHNGDLSALEEKAILGEFKLQRADLEVFAFFPKKANERELAECKWSFLAREGISVSSTPHPRSANTPANRQPRRPPGPRKASSAPSSPWCPPAVSASLLYIWFA